jgi:ABC-type transporter Mla maintaining outer membrane lipid asymmetry ATPase subunit MlaF/ABC-type transporter Mla maintaining outer membrane lipid asymmetry permease subunit MlaE
VRGLRVVLPNGRVLIDDVSLDVAPGEVVVLLGGSGTGKSTFSRVLFERDELERAGFEVVAERLTFDRGELGLVPQRGALFDHLDVHGNLDLALRYARPDDSLAPAVAGSPADWLARVGLDPQLATAGTAVGSLSGGQAQRVAVARVLAGRRQILFLDEPSVGLDPLRVRMLARLIREQAKTLGLSAIVVTHDVALAAGCADRMYVLSLASRRLEELYPGEWPGAMERDGVPDDERGRWLVRLESDLIKQMELAATHAAGEPRRPGLGRKLAALGEPLVAPFRIAGTSLYFAPAQAARRTADFALVWWRVTRQALLRPLPFYAIVSVLIGYTVLYVISKVGGAGVRPDALVRQIGGAHVVALAPALSAMLFVAASGSATNAWLGSMGLTKQVLAMEALGVDSRAYLWAPAWIGLATAYLCVAALFALGMIAGGLLLCHQLGVADPWALLTGDLLDPRPERVRYAVRAGVLVWFYAWGIASDVVAKGGAAKPEADAVTRGMTASVVACTLWVVAWELITVLVVFRL